MTTVKANQAPLINGGSHIALKARGITEETCKKWNYKVADLGARGHCHVANYCDATRTVVAQKLRFANKEFTTTGDWKQAGLYGKWLWGGGGKKVVITEGEIDAMSVSQQQGHKWPVVSLPTGAQSAQSALKRDLEWLESFEEIILMFDMDEVGQTAARKCSTLFTPGKCKVAVLHDAKDANELLLAGRGEEIINAIWRAQEVRPDGLVTGLDAWSYIERGKEIHTMQYPWECANTISYGLRVGEIVTVVAGTGTGKSTSVKEIEKFLWDSGEKVGHIALEENVRQSILAFMSLHMNKRLHLLGNSLDTEEVRPVFNEIMRDERLFFYDSWGSADIDRLKELIRFLAKGKDCRWIVLDHISIVVSGMEGGDERRIIDNLMTSLRSMVEELQIGLILISHLKRTSGTPAEQGGEITLQDLRGSQSIAQLSDIVWAIERNQQDPDSKLISLLRCLKNRFSGDTGIAGYLHFDIETGRTVEGDAPPEKEPEEHRGPAVGFGAHVEEPPAEGSEDDIPF